MSTITQTRKHKKALRTLSAMMTALLLFSPGGLVAGNLPSGHKVMHGDVSIATKGNVMNINQYSGKAIVNWKDFSIGAGNVVNVIQTAEKAAMLARVTGNDVSKIMGNLNVNQSFYLVNPNGVYFGKDSKVDVGAMFAASTLDINDADFLTGKMLFSGNSSASVINDGEISADAVALIAKNIVNNGDINARQVVMAGTGEVELFNFGDDAKLTLKFGEAVSDDTTVVVNNGTVDAGMDDGDVILFSEAGESDNTNGTIIAKDLEFSGKAIDLKKLGNVQYENLLLDPDDVFLGTATSSPNEWTIDELAYLTGNVMIVAGDTMEVVDNINFANATEVSLGATTFKTNDYTINAAGNLTIMAMDDFKDSLSANVKGALDVYVLGDGSELSINAVRADSFMAYADKITTDSYFTDTIIADQFVDLSAVKMALHGTKIEASDVNIYADDLTIDDRAVISATTRAIEIEAQNYKFEHIALTAAGDVLIQSDVEGLFTSDNTGVGTLVTAGGLLEVRTAGHTLFNNATLQSSKDISINGTPVYNPETEMIDYVGSVSFAGTNVFNADNNARLLANVSAKNEGSASFNALNGTAGVYAMGAGLDTVDMTGLTLNVSGKNVLFQKDAFVNDGASASLNLFATNAISVDGSIDLFNDLVTGVKLSAIDGTISLNNDIKATTVVAAANEMFIGYDGTNPSLVSDDPRSITADYLLDLRDVKRTYLHTDTTLELVNETFGNLRLGNVEAAVENVIGYPVLKSLDVKVAAKGAETYLNGEIKAKDIAINGGYVVLNNDAQLNTKGQGDINITAEEIEGTSMGDDQYSLLMNAKNVTVEADITVNTLTVKADEKAELNGKINAAGNVAVDAAEYTVADDITAAGDVNVNVIGNALVINGAVKAGNEIAMQADSVQNGEGTDLSTVAGDITLIANEGDINLADASVTAGSRRVVMTAAGNIESTGIVGELQNASFNAGNDAKLTLVGGLTDSTIVAGNELNLNAAELNGNTLVAENGELAVTASGLINETSMTAKEDSVILNTADIIASNIIAKQNITLTGNDSEAANVVMNAEGDITISSYKSLNKLSAKAAGDITATESITTIIGTELNADGKVELTAEDALINNTVTSADDVTLNATDVQGGTYAGNKVSVTASYDIKGTEFNAAKDVTVNANSVNAANIFAEGKVTLTAEESLVNNTVTSADDVTLKASDVQGGTYAGNTITATLENDVFSTAFVADGDVIISEVNSVVMANILAAGKVELTAEESLINNTIASADNVTLSASNVQGGTYDGNNITVTASKDVVGAGFIAATDVTITADYAGVDDIIANGKATVTAQTKLDNLFITADIAELTATEGNINGNQAYVKTSATLWAGKEIDSTEVTAIGVKDAIAIEANALQIAASSFIAEDGDVKVGTDGRLTDLVNVTVWAKNGNSDIKVTNELDGVAITAKGDLTVEAKYLVGDTIVSEEGNVSASAEESIVDTAVLAKKGNVTASAKNITGETTLTALEGNVNVQGNDGDNVNVINTTIQAASDITIENGDAITNVVALVTEDGAIGISANSVDGGELTADTVTITGNEGDVSIGTDGNVEVNGNLVVNNDADVILGSVTVDGEADITAEGSIADGSEGEGPNVTAVNVKLTAKDGSIGVDGDNLNLSTEGIEATAENGSIDLQNTSSSDVVVNGLTAKDDVNFAEEGTGNVSIEGEVKSEEGDVIVEAEKNIEINASISATGEEGNVGIATEMGDIDVDEDAEITAGEDVVIESGLNANLDGNITAGNDVSIVTGFGTEINGAVTAGNDVNVEAGNVDICGPVNAENDVKIEAVEEIEISEDVTAGNDVKLGTIGGGDVKQESDTTIEAKNGKVEITTAKGGNVEIENIIAGEEVDIDADGKVLRTDTDDDTDITAPSVVINANEGIGNVVFDDEGNADEDQFVKISKAETVDLDSNGDNADIAVSLSGADSVEVIAKTDGNDSDIFISSDETVSEIVLGVEGSSDEDEMVIAKDGDVVINTPKTDIIANRVRALDDGVVNEYEDDAYSVIITGRDVTVADNGIISDFNGIIFSFGDTTLGNESIVTGNDTNITSQGDVISTGGDTNIITGGDINITVGGSVGDAESNMPITVDAEGEVHVKPEDGNDNNGKGPDYVWVYMQGDSIDNSIHYDGNPNKEPGIIYWNGVAWYGQENPMNQIDREVGEFQSRVNDIVARYNGYYWSTNTTYYFPHVRSMFDDKAGDKAIEHILSGAGVIEGLPEGVQPIEINILQLDESFTWYDGVDWNW